MISEQRKEYMRKYARTYYLDHKDKINERARGSDKRYRTKLRKTVMDILGGAICSNCGCDAFEALEINHINGGGRKEMKSHSNYTNYLREIRDGKVDITEYNVLCRVCHARHYLEDIIGITGHKIIWTGS